MCTFSMRRVAEQIGPEYLNSFARSGNMLRSANVRVASMPHLKPKLTIFDRLGINCRD